MTAPQGRRPSDDEHVPRKVRGIVILDGEYEDTVEGARASWRSLLEQAVEGCPPVYAFVRPCERPMPVNGLSERQFHMDAAIEYIEMEYLDGVPLHPEHVKRLLHMLAGLPLDGDHPVQDWMRIPADEAGA